MEVSKVEWEDPMRVHYDNKSVINTAYNYVQHDWTKHTEVDRYYIKRKLDNCLIWTPFIIKGEKLIDILTK